MILNKDSQARLAKVIKFWKNNLNFLDDEIMRVNIEYSDFSKKSAVLEYLLTAKCLALGKYGQLVTEEVKND